MSINDEMVRHAYDSGHKDGMAHEQKTRSRSFLDNANRAMALGNQVFKKMRNTGLHPRQTYLRPTAATRFDILITLPLDEFCGEAALGAYRLFEEVGFTADDCRVEYHLAPDDNLDEQSIKADGYAFRRKAEAVA